MNMYLDFDAFRSKRDALEEQAKGDIVGIVTSTDIVRYIAENSEEINTKVSDLMKIKTMPP